MRLFFAICLLLNGSIVSAQQFKFSPGKEEPVISSNLALPHNEPHLAANPSNSNHLVGACIVFDQPDSSEEKTHIAVFATKDKGKTWKQTDLEMETGYDPWIAVRDDRKVMLVALVKLKSASRPSLMCYVSNDGGFTWSLKPQNLGTAHDHPTLTIDQFSNNRLYLLSSVVKRNKENQKVYVNYLNYTDDWEKFRDTALHFITGTTNSNTLTVAVKPDGKIILPYIEYEQESGQQKTAVLKFVGATSHRIDSVSSLITSRKGFAKGFPVLTIDCYKYKGRMYLLKNSGDQRSVSNGIFLQFSDDGISWSDEIRVDHNPNEVKFMRTAAMSVNKDGIIGIAWYDRRNDTARSKNDIYFTMSTDGGKTFQMEKRITGTASDPEDGKNGKAANRFPAGGDYMGCVADAEGNFRILWSDSRSGVYQLYTCLIKVKY